MGFFRNITRRDWVAADDGRTYTPLRVLAQRRWLAYFGKEGLHDGYYKPLLPENYPQDPQNSDQVPQGYRTWYGLEISNKEEEGGHKLSLPQALTDKQFTDLNNQITAYKRSVAQQKAEGAKLPENPYTHNDRIFLGNLWTWRKLVPPMGIFNLIKLTWAITFDLLDWCLQHIQARPYDQLQSRAQKVGFILWMPIFTIVRAAIYLAFNIPLSVLEIITSPINKVLRPIMRFYDDFEPTAKGSSRGPFFAALSIAILATVFIGVALFLSATTVFAYAPIFQHVLMAVNAFFEHALTILPFALNAAAVIAIKASAIFVTFVASMRFLEGVATHLRNGVPDTFGFVTGKGGDECLHEDTLTAQADLSGAEKVGTVMSRILFGTNPDQTPHSIHIKPIDQFASFFGKSINSGPPEPVSVPAPSAE